LRNAGLPDWFKVAREVLPGAYTFILPASKNMPKLKMVDGKVKKKTKQRSTVGVRIPDHPVCQEILNLLGRCVCLPLLFQER
jgi:tRNA A37 threonylcarbamoyladenosine synthetase subunit TsaC/SUA5/YrdC